MRTAERVPVLMYHRIGDAGNDAEAIYCVKPQTFAEHMHRLAERGYRAVPVDALVQWLEGGPALRQGDFVLTFDDGYAGVREHALPVLTKLQWPFTVFLVTDLLGKRDAWSRHDGARGGQHQLLGPVDIAAMQDKGCSFHSHSCTHASLVQLDQPALVRELEQSRVAVSRLRGDADPIYLAYPYGHVDDRVEAAARVASYRAAFSVQPGFNRRDANPMRIRRIDVFGGDTSTMLLRKIQWGTNDGSLRSALGYYRHRVAARIVKRGA